ncbi:MAG TPA: (2Fe-2S)-binding protein [Gemmatimonadaceae bacterium]|nr:(2Fe-2S)-binding protein [Gemmatimonadaceae bacterium]
MTRATVEISIDGTPARVDAGVSVASALLNAGITSFRRSKGDTPRAPLCGMGVCQECRVTIDGVAHRRACMVTVADGMRIATDAEAAR